MISTAGRPQFVATKASVLNFMGTRQKVDFRATDAQGTSIDRGPRRAQFAGAGKFRVPTAHRLAVEDTDIYQDGLRTYLDAAESFTAEFYRSKTVSAVLASLFAGIPSVALLGLGVWAYYASPSQSPGLLVAAVLSIPMLLLVAYSTHNGYKEDVAYHLERHAKRGSQYADVRTRYTDLRTATEKKFSSLRSGNDKCSYFAGLVDGFNEDNNFVDVIGEWILFADPALFKQQFLDPDAVLTSEQFLQLSPKQQARAIRFLVYRCFVSDSKFQKDDLIVFLLVLTKVLGTLSHSVWHLERVVEVLESFRDSYIERREHPDRIAVINTWLRQHESAQKAVQVVQSVFSSQTDRSRQTSDDPVLDLMADVLRAKEADDRAYLLAQLEVELEGVEHSAWTDGGEEAIQRLQRIVTALEEVDLGSEAESLAHLLKARKTLVRLSAARDGDGEPQRLPREAVDTGTKGGRDPRQAARRVDG